MKNKKVLIIGSDEEFTLEKMYERAFKSIGLKVTLLNAYKIKKLLYKNFFGNI